jgi:hypothetical protein
MNLLNQKSGQFNIKEVTIAGDECILVTPKDMGVDWDEDNKYFRSSIWRKWDMYPVSLGFRKFMNYGEKPSFEPIDGNSKFTAVRKVDGSCLIVSKYKDELIIRTRGTVDATKLENGAEIALLKQKYPHAFNNHYINKGRYTLLFEWTTPSNRIVLNETTEPTLWLIGMVAHRDEEEHKFYSYASQDYLDLIAEFLEVKRPETYKLYALGSIENLKRQIEPLKDIEGVVIYDESGQNLKKIKTLRYLQLHRVFTGVKTVNHILELWKEYGCTERENFETLLATNFDWELVESLKGLLDEFFNKLSHIQNKIKTIRVLLSNYKNLPRKDIAQIIFTELGAWSSIAFEILDNKSHKIEKLFELQNHDDTNYILHP